MRALRWLPFFCASALLGLAAPTPVLIDTDIGTDVDDAYVLALLMRCPELEVLGVTTVSGDAPKRAQLAAKFLALGGGRWRDLPVVAGISGVAQPQEQCDWAAGYAAANLRDSGGVEFLREQINRRPGEITIVALGELTNIAALLASERGLAAKIKRIMLMGGALTRGYAEGSAPEPEWNIRCNVAAARAVFASGVPLMLAPLDATITLKLDGAKRLPITLAGRPETDALAALTAIWTQTNPWHWPDPILYDALPVALLCEPILAPSIPQHIVIDDNGLTRAVHGAKPNADVVTQSDPAKILGWVARRLGQ
jgi:inosine-uridine nucleoside N-ribohydrolase